MSGRNQNLLFLWTDEQRPDTIGAYGVTGGEHGGTPASRIQTPNLDRLAAGGTLFEQAYCAQPVCTPSRGTVLTGVYPHTHGATHNNVPLPAPPEGVTTIAELLRPHGYRCGYAGKWHLGTELHPQRGFDWWASMEDGYVKDHQRDGFSTYHQWLVGQGYTPPDTASDGSRVFGRGTAARLPEAAGKPAFLAEQACRFLDEHVQAHGREGAPFALYVNFLEPHMPFFGPWDAAYPAEAMALPETWYAEPDAGMPLRHRLRRESYAGHNPHVETNDERGWKGLVARYWGLAGLVDKYVGRILDRLEALGLADDTIVVYSTDHGDMMGEHRLIAKGVQYEGAARVPLIVRVPGPVRTRDGQRQELAPGHIATPVGQVDVLPTLLAALDVEAPAHLQGRSLLPLMAGGDTPATLEEAEVVFEWSGARDGVAADGQRFERSGASGQAVAAQQRTIRRGRWKLTVDEAGEHELYDLTTDPHETRNLLYGDRLVHNANAAAAVTHLWERLRAWQARTDDTAALPAPAPWSA